MAEKQGTSLIRLMRDREGTRLFAGLDAQGNLSAESMACTAAAVQRMAENARKAGADMLRIFATSASRDAANGAEFIRLVQQAAGEPPEILSGREEAILSFAGASAVVREADPCGVIDIGGGSTELVIGGSAGIERAASCQIGAVRLFRLIPIRGREDMPAVEKAAAQTLAEDFPELPGSPFPRAWAGTGGTFTTLSAMARKVPWTDRTNMHGTRIRLEAVQAIGEELADMTPEARKTLPGLQPSRADIVVHGICILMAVMRHLRIEEVAVSEWGNLDGYLRRKYCIGRKDAQACLPR